MNEWTPSEHVADMLRCSVGRIALKRLRELQAKMSGHGTDLAIALPHDADVQHVTDWLTTDFINGADWIKRTDGQHRPLKLMKCGSIEQLLHEADKAMRKRLQGKNVALGEGDETFVAELAGGFTVTRLLTPRALDLESRQMRHCVGHGSYDHDVVKGLTEIYSLRDPGGQPRVTVEINVSHTAMVDGNLILLPPDRRTKEVIEIQGRVSSCPPREHMHILRPFLKEFADWKN
ncbi:hypothetical protein FKO01_04110 [Mesorhizobium sp. B2-3-3]|nr:hypothetical protein FKO01_04110 [Mesorhizobium sp. B2-3-3]